MALNQNQTKTACPSASDAPLRRFVVSDGQRPANVNTLYCYEPRSVVLAQIAASTTFMGEDILDQIAGAPGALVSVSPTAAGAGDGVSYAYAGIVEEYTFNFQGSQNVSNAFTYQTGRGLVTNDNARVTVTSNNGACATECATGTLSLFAITGNVIDNRFFFAPAMINQDQQLAAAPVKLAHTLTNNITGFPVATITTTQRIPTPQQNEGLYQLWFMTFFGIDLQGGSNG
jgi:hypothetical protein